MEQEALNFNQISDISDETVSRCKDFRAAIRLCIEVSGMQCKEVAHEIGINKDHLARMINTSEDPRHFPPELLNKLMDVCRNEVPLRWLANSRGYGLKRLKSALEIELDQVKAERDEERKEKELLLKLIKQVKN